MKKKTESWREVGTLYGVPLAIKGSADDLRRVKEFLSEMIKDEADRLFLLDPVPMKEIFFYWAHQCLDNVLNLHKVLKDVDFDGKGK